MPHERESDIVTAICDYLAYRGHFFWRSNNVPVYDRTRGTYRALPKHTMKGLPDITVVKDGRYIGIEVKTKKGILSEDQAELDRQLIKHGAQYHVVHSIDEVVALGL